LRKHEWAGHMDSTLEFSHGYTFFKLAGYRLLLSLSFPFFFSFHFLLYPKLTGPSILGLWTFTLRYFYRVYPHVLLSFLALLFSLISRGIYRVFLGFLKDSLKDWSKLSPLIKMRELWTNGNSWNLPFNGFWGWWFCLGGFLFLGEKDMHFSPSNLGWKIYSPW